MAKEIRATNEVVNAALDANASKANGGKLRLYDGVRPTTGDTALGSQVQLAELTMGTPAFGAAVAGVITANAITQDSAADASGTATWYRMWKSDGTTPLWDGTVGTSDADLILNTTSISAGVIVQVSSFTMTLPK